MCAESVLLGGRRGMLHRPPLEKVPNESVVVLAAGEKQGGVRGAPGHGQDALRVALELRERQSGGRAQVPHVDHGVGVVAHRRHDLEALGRVPHDVADGPALGIAQLTPFF